MANFNSVVIGLRIRRMGGGERNRGIIYIRGMGREGREIKVRITPSYDDTRKGEMCKENKKGRRKEKKWRNA